MAGAKEEGNAAMTQQGQEDRARLADPADEESDKEEADWEDWKADSQQGGAHFLGADQEDEAEFPSRCLFCSAEFPSASDVFSHCSSSHSFDFYALKAGLKLDFYDSIRVINYIRKHVSLSQCIFCNAPFPTGKDLLAHMKAACHEKLPLEKSDRHPAEASDSTLLWKADEYLTPVLENDPLLYSFEDDDGDGSGDAEASSLPLIIPESQAFLGPESEDGLRVLADLVEEEQDDRTTVAEAVFGEASVGDGNAKDQSGSSYRSSEDEGIQGAQGLAHENYALRLENEELRAELAALRKHSVSPKVPPTPHPTPAGSPFRQPVKEGILSALGPPHTLRSLEKIGEEGVEGEDSAEVENVAEGELLDVECNNGAVGEDNGGLNFMNDRRTDATSSQTFAAGSKKEKRKGTKGKVTFAAVAEREAQEVDSGYFKSYGEFGIHREMLSDKVRTEAYRTALLENPSLLKGAVVMDVGCGTGILSLFAAQGGASSAVAVDASAKIASVARQVAQDNGYLAGPTEKDSSSKGRPVVSVVLGKVEDLRPAQVREVADDTRVVGEVQAATSTAAIAAAEIAEGAESKHQHMERKSVVPVKEKTVDVLVSEWMGYCLLFESMLPSVLHARDTWLKPGGAVLPDIARMYVAGFGKGGTSLSFWEDVYGFNMAVVGREVTEQAAQVPIVDVVAPGDVITPPFLIQSFDITSMEHEDVDFTSYFHLQLSSTTKCHSSSVLQPSGSSSPAPNAARAGHSEESAISKVTEACYGLVVWFDVEFSDRFCKEKPVVMSTSPLGPPTHWSQTKLTFKEPVVLAHTELSATTPNVPCTGSPSQVDGQTGQPIVRKQAIGTELEPASALTGRISIARSARHRSIDISLETAATARDGSVRRWPVQMFDI